MRQELLKKATISLELALEARTIEYQTRHACDARAFYDQARQALQAFAAKTRSITTEAARLIATQAAIFEAGELAEFEKRLTHVEDRVAQALREPPGPMKLGRLFSDPAST
jgi:hypothetical protein